MLLTALLLLVAAPSSSDLYKSDAFEIARQRQDQAAMTRACIPMKSTRTYEGVWYDTFEGQEFFDRAMTLAVNHALHSSVWLEINRKDALVRANLPGRIAEVMTPHAYRVRFVGAETLNMSCDERDAFGLPSCFGHEGAFPGMVVVERILAIEAL